MKKTTYCENCNVPLPHGRADQHFCSAACCAEFARNHGDYRTRFHAWKARWTERRCEHCGGIYWTNDYGNRGGQRKPRFCSDRCRVAYHRAKVKGQQQHTANAGNGQQQQQQQQHTEQPKTRQNAPKREFWDGYANRYDAALAILQIERGFTQRQLKAAWLKAVFAVHPDRNSDPDATWLTQRVNWAYDYLKIG